MVLEGPQASAQAPPLLAKEVSRGAPVFWTCLSLCRRNLWAAA
eukprot:CAMPEP_0115128170 /NCGR_PEP_ID=MMETSP0227-20121206/50924_1 /TAXON_ID=89957 /ORGANISM="Polarella glacialis, Strain CCMP 1383" /LENGTH=42 /DNA_ID= /DNA_START= /DNA_END= /DNA_ORIENTATION=